MKVAQVKGGTTDFLCTGCTNEGGTNEGGTNEGGTSEGGTNDSAPILEP